MAKIYKSETTCAYCEKPILWFAIINKRVGEVFSFSESDYRPHREVKIVSYDDKAALLRIRCKECDKENSFNHTLPDD